MVNDHGDPAAKLEARSDIESESELKRRVARCAEGARAAGGDQPLVAIAATTYLPPVGLFERLVESIRAQDRGSWICVVSDDRSPADRLGAIRSLIRDDERFVLSPSPARLGMSGNFERALAAIGESADLVAIADQSDRWHPEKLSRLIRALGSDGALAYADVRLLGPDGRALAERLCNSGRRPPAIDSLSDASLVPGSAMLFRRELLDLALPFPQRIGIRHDHWLALAALAEGEIRFEDAVLTEHCATDPKRALALADAGGPRRLRRSGRRRTSNGLDKASEREAASMLRERRARNGSPQLALSSNAAATPGSDLAIRVQGVSKTFAIPASRPESLRGRLRHPLPKLHNERLTALSDVSFEVARGEFFGIAGANGSGKTTLLQILANIYQADAGRVWIAPRVAPIISLGIGFHPDLQALPNVLTTAELLGVPASETRRRFDEVLAFAGLEEFANLKLRNYSTGMRVRLAFATVMLVDADVLLLDEVMAVGDELFKERTRKAFDELASTKTVILVTHHMANLVSYCDRALLLNRGRVEMLGDPSEVARRYAELGLESHGESTDLPPTAAALAGGKPSAEIADLWLVNAREERIGSVAAGDEIRLHATVAAIAHLDRPGLRLEIRRWGAARIFAPPTLSLGDGAQSVRAGGQVKVEAAIENKLAPGRYTAVCTVTADRNGDECSVSAAQTLDFVVAAGGAETFGVVDLQHSVRARRQRRRQPRRPTSGAEGR